uniref:F-box associated beta-propeller type 3 domain-containing protein n=1 Tax=Lactuca sativa TaxID=4236 RepID=A0A9R1UKD3_LACSA|nr:hypothetical protein LSAT_V11C800398740 [Lactuca sativa]
MGNREDGSDEEERLLAKQLAQMRCICKDWNALLSKSSFVKSHLHHSIQNNDDIFLLFKWGHFLGCNPFIARPVHSLAIKPTNFIKLPVNFQSKNSFKYRNVIGSVNGLICFSYNLYDGGYVVHIWNPSLSAVLTLPPCSSRSRNSETILFRFGYDPKTDDYKVVKITCLSNPRRIEPQVEVYSMRKGSWELISQSFPSHITIIMDHDDVCVDGHNGHLHWFGSTGLEWKPETILAFDLGVETFSEIPPPPDSLLHHHGHCFSVLGVLGGKFCLMSSVRDGKCEVWVMDEYGVAESWVKRRFCLYDPVAARSKIFKIKGDGQFITKIVEYVDSLVWVAPAKHELSKWHVLISILNRNQLLKGLQMAITGIFRFLFQR